MTIRPPARLDGAAPHDDHPAGEPRVGAPNGPKPAARGEHRLKGHLDDREVGSPVTEIAERGEDPLVIEARHRENQGVRWKGPWGKHAQVLPGVAWPRRARQQYVEKPVEMALSDARLDPLHEPPEADDPDPVVLGLVRGHQVDGGSHARVKSRF